MAIINCCNAFTLELIVINIDQKTLLLGFSLCKKYELQRLESYYIIDNATQSA